MTVKKRILRILKILLIVLLAALCLGAIANLACNLMLRSYINSFEPVEYTDRLVPEKIDGYYTYTTDDDLKVMQLTDVHVGGGFWTFKEDKKTIYEIITMVQQEKPDLVVLGGDNVFCVPGIKFNGGFTFNNKMAETTVMDIFEHEGVYFTTVFGNHDTESFDFYSREQISELFESDKFEYCIYESQFRDPDADTVPSESNQIIVVKNTDGTTRKLILLIDTNAYVDTSIQASMNWLYDTIHPAQIEWAAESIKQLSKDAGLPDGEYLKTVCILHIPVGEYEDALEDLLSGDPKNTEYVSGDWADSGIFYGGCSNDGTPESQDQLFETLADDMGCLEAILCGHDHLNNAVVKYKGVYLSYGYSVDNIAYGSYMKTSGLQRGATVLTIRKTGNIMIAHKNAYKDYGCSTTKFWNVQLDSYPVPEQVVELPQ